MARRDGRGIDLTPAQPPEPASRPEPVEPGSGPGRAATPRAPAPVIPTRPDPSNPPVSRPSRVPVRVIARRRVTLALIVALAVVGATVLATWLIYRGDDQPEAALPGQVVGGEGSSVLLVVTGADRRTVAVGLLSRGEDTASDLMLLPASLETDLPGYGLAELADATRFEGPGLTALAIMNDLGIRIDVTLSFATDQFAAAVGGPVAVDVPSPLIVEEGSTSRVVVAAGQTELDGAAAALLMTTPGTGTKLEWLDRQRAVWEAVLARWSESPAPVLDLARDQMDDVGAVDRVLSGAPVTVSALPVSPLGVGGGTEVYTVARPDGETFLATRLGFLLMGSDRPRVEVLNGSGRVGTARPVAEVLIRHGYRVVRTDNADRTDYAESLFIAQGLDNQPAARLARNLLGAGEVVLQDRAASGVVDVSVIVGRDLANQEG